MIDFDLSVSRPAAQHSAVCNTSGSGADLPAQPGLVADTHGPLPHNASLFMGFAFMLTVSSGSDRLTNRLSSDEEEGEGECRTMPISVFFYF